MKRWMVIGALVALGCGGDGRGGDMIECNPVGSYDLTVVELEPRLGGGCGPVDGAELVTVPFDARLTDFAGWDDCAGTFSILESDTDASQCGVEWSFTCFYDDGEEVRAGRVFYVDPSTFQGEEVYRLNVTDALCESRYQVTLRRIGG